MLFIVFLRSTTYKVIKKFTKVMDVGAFEIEEDLPNYFTTLDDRDRNWSIEEEKNCRT